MSSAISVIRSRIVSFERDITSFYYYVFLTLALPFLQHMVLQEFQLVWGFFCFAMVSATSEEASTSKIFSL